MNKKVFSGLVSCMSSEFPALSVLSPSNIAAILENQDGKNCLSHGSLRADGKTKL